MAKHLRWLALDNAAKIYPAARRNNWSNVYRLSVTLTEPVDKAVLQSALQAVAPRFPSICARLRKGLFWYYLEQLEQPPQIRGEQSYPMVHMTRAEIRQCALRVIVYKNRLALEIFHALTDGTGAMIFLKSLLAEYLRQKYNITVPAEKGVLDINEEPSDRELEDSFLKHEGNACATRGGTDAWHISGTREPDGFLHNTCLELPTATLLERAHQYGVTATGFLAAVMLMAMQNIQLQQVPEIHRRKSIKVMLPVNLRQLFPSKTLRNFAMFTVPEIQPRLGYYEFEEICKQVKHRMGLDINAKHMSTIIAANVSNERKVLIRMIPLFIKNMVMKMVFDMVGERKSSISLSNLGRVEIPEVMKDYVNRFDFIMGIQASAPNNCGVLSWGDRTYVNFIRNIKEPSLEQSFYQVLRQLNIPVTVRSNGGDR
jgi:NRPS condensation-like uncharacterized protein